jgi:hypothetical protein
MFRLSFPQRIAALGLAAVLTVSWVSAAPPVRQNRPSARRAAAPVGFIQQLLSLWMEVLDEGCHLDPDGRCATVDAGCHLDPSGGCATVDEGCHVDPSGGCAGGSW